MLSNGIPMFRAGDEFGHTQAGDNNPYNVDNTSVWLDWDNLKYYSDMFSFCKGMITFRKDHHSICRDTFWEDDIIWFGTNQQGADFSSTCRTMAFLLKGGSVGDTDIYVMINAHDQDLAFTVHAPGVWHVAVDTADIANKYVYGGYQGNLAQKVYQVTSRSIVVLLAK